MHEKLRQIKERYVNRETVTYVIFGVLTTAVNYAVYYPLRALGVNYLISNVIAWIVAVTFAFFTNKHFVFESKDYSLSVLLPELGKFVAGRLITLGLEELLMYVSVDLLHFNDRIMKLIVSVLIIILNYVFSKLFIFTKKEKTDED
ncbi:MAG: GtrA family protein [Lachnospiraceae bacterium]|nr:GtrA family protein [Lachnospiraceae bacterium]